MCRPRLGPYHITDTQTLRLTAFVADPARADDDFEDLAALVRVPVGTGARQECYVRNPYVFISHHFVDVNIAGEGPDDFAGIDGAGAWGGGASYDLGGGHD